MSSINEVYLSCVLFGLRQGRKQLLLYESRSFQSFFFGALAAFARQDAGLDVLHTLALKPVSGRPRRELMTRQGLYACGCLGATAGGTIREVLPDLILMSLQA